MIQNRYRDVPESELNLYRHFLKTHTSKYIDFRGQLIEYYSCVQGEKTILLPPGAAGGLIPPEFMFEVSSILKMITELSLPAWLKFKH